MPSSRLKAIVDIRQDEQDFFRICRIFLVNSANILSILSPMREADQDGMLLVFTSDMIRKLKSGKYRLYSRKVDPKTKKRKNLGTFDSREAAEKHERAVQYFKRAG